MRDYFRPIIIFTRFNLLRFFRDKVYIFFMLILPVMFLFVFGTIFGGNNFSAFDVAFFNHSSSELSQTVSDIITSEDGVLTKVGVSDRSEAEEKLIRGELVAIIELPESFGEITESGLPSGQIEVVYSQGSEQAGQAIAAVLDSITTELNTQITGRPPILTVSSTVLTKDGLTNFDYVFAGLLGYTIMTVGLLGIANIFPSDKESGAVKRLRATTIKPSQLVLSYAMTFLLIGILVFIIMVVLGLLVFNFNMRGSWLTLAIFSAISTAMMLGFGLAVGGSAKTEAQSSALAQLIMFPMMFLSGVFFPMFLMPEFVQSISKFMPLTPIVDGIRLIITENFTLIDVLPQLGIIAAWGVIIYIVAIRTFRWE